MDIPCFKRHATQSVTVTSHNVFDSCNQIDNGATWLYQKVDSHILNFYCFSNNGSHIISDSLAVGKILSLYLYHFYISEFLLFF